MKQSGLGGQLSGYAGDVSKWQSFLDCWRTALAARPTQKSTLPDRNEPTILSKFTVLRDAAEPDRGAVALEIQALEARLAVTLPPSYRDFLLAYRPPDYKPHTTPTGELLRIGMYAPKQVDRLQVLEPDLVRIFAEPSLAYDTPDADYFRYGIDQDDVAIRTSYRADSIVVGSHGPALHDLLVLHPRAVTADGEMEAAMMMHSGEFRAPSFAELMRQIAHMELKRPNSAPPYAQTELVGGCGDHLKPNAPWWR